MLGSVLPFTPELADKVSDYCEKHSEDKKKRQQQQHCHTRAAFVKMRPCIADLQPLLTLLSERKTALPKRLEEHWEWTIRTWMDAEMMSSKLQGQWMIWTAQLLAPARVLEVGTYTGFSALAWYEGTRETQAEIVTLDVRGEVLNFTRKMFASTGVDDRVRVVEGPAATTLQDERQVAGQFDLIFLDADKHNYQVYLDTILTRRLLAPRGVILVDNVFARGLTMGEEFNPYMEQVRRPFWLANGETLRKLNRSFLEDERIDTLLLPLFDGVTQIKWKQGYLERMMKAEGKEKPNGSGA